MENPPPKPCFCEGLFRNRTKESMGRVITTYGLTLNFQVSISNEYRYLLCYFSWRFINSDLIVIQG